MAFTRFHDDPARQMKANQQSTGPGRWTLDVPGNGLTPCFALDPQIIPQKWGANLWSNSIDVQSGLLGIDKGLNRDCLSTDSNGINKYKRLNINTYPMKNEYPVCDKFLTTEQSRVIMPAWTARSVEQNNFDYLYSDPQKHTNMSFKNNVSTRILEKDNFQRTFDCLPMNNQFYTLPVNVQKGGYIGGPKTCMGDGQCEKI